jgi:ABC-type bacteriocin/lantibiotic exporter with double-glycine peptidase domain
MILHHFGDRTPYRKLLKELECHPDKGTTVHAILRAFRMRGFSVQRNCHMNMRDLKKAITSRHLVLAHVDGDHYVVAHDFNEEHIYVADPSIVRLLGRRQTHAEFRKRWTSWGLIVRPRL